jgi:lysozyme family protein
MANNNFDGSLKLVLAHEGGFVNHPADPGGPTNFGVTQKVYDAYRRNKGLATRTVRLIEAEEVADIYRNQYWGAPCDSLPAGLDYAIFDYSVNSGRSRAVADLQRTLNDRGAKLKIDGHCGEGTIDAANADADNAALIEALCDRRMSFLKALKTYKTFGKGWKRRVEGAQDGAQDGDNGVVDFACHMARTAAVAGTPTPPPAPLPLPAPIGAHVGEIAGKGETKDIAVTRTPGGIGAITGGIAVSGATVMQAANTVKPHMTDAGWLGRLALIGFTLLMIFGVGLVIYEWYQKQREQKVPA